MTLEKPAAALTSAPPALDLTSNAEWRQSLEIAPSEVSSNKPVVVPTSKTEEATTEAAVTVSENAYPIRPLMNLSFSDPGFPDLPSRAINWKRAEAKIDQLVRSRNRLRAGVIIKDLKSGHTYERNADQKFASASLVKIPIVLALYNDFQSGRVDPFEPPLYDEKHRIGGSGWLKNEEANRRVPYRDLIYMMLAKSDNTAANVLSNVVGMDRITEYCGMMGWSRTDMVREVMALDLRKRGIENWTTPRDMAGMLEGLYKGDLVSRSASRDILRFMNNPPIADRLPKKLPRSIDVVHKTGLIYDNAHDVGILYLPGEQPVLVVALVDRIGTRYRDAKDFISELAKILYEESASAS